MIARAALALVALVAVAWFAVTWNDARSLVGAQTAATAVKPSRARLEAAVRDAHDARALNPDKETPLSTSVALYVRLGHPAQALAAIKRLTKLEPQNVEGWVFLAGLSEQQDPALAARALRRAQQLDPSFRPPKP